MVFGGCASEPGEQKLKVGTVDVMRVMEERPETRAIRLEWSSQAGDTAMRISALKDPAEAEALKKEIEKRSKAWQNKVDDFMEESVNLIEAEAAAIAEERGIDLVVVDNAFNPYIRYRDGEDLSLDVSMKLQTRDE